MDIIFGVYCAIMFELSPDTDTHAAASLAHFEYKDLFVVVAVEKSLMPRSAIITPYYHSRIICILSTRSEIKMKEKQNKTNKWLVCFENVIIK